MTPTGKYLCRLCRAHGRTERGSASHNTVCLFAHCPCSECVAIRELRARGKKAQERAQERVLESKRAMEMAALRATAVEHMAGPMAGPKVGPPAWAPSGLLLGPRRGTGWPRKTQIRPIKLCKSCRAHGQTATGNMAHALVCPFAQCPCSECVAVREFNAKRRQRRATKMETLRATAAGSMAGSMAWSMAEPARPPTWAPRGLILGPRRGPGRPRKSQTPTTPPSGLCKPCQAHGQTVTESRFHAPVCPFAQCPCAACVAIRESYRTCSRRAVEGERPTARAPSGPQRGGKRQCRLCRACRAHGRAEPIDGVTHDCPFALCPCSECVRVRKARASAASYARASEIRKKAMKSLRVPSKPRGLIMVPVVTLEDGGGPAAPAASSICTEFLVTKRTKLKKAGRASGSWRAHRRASAKAASASAPQCAPEADRNPAGAPQFAQPQVVLEAGPAGLSADPDPSAGLHAGLHLASAFGAAEVEATETTRLHDGDDQGDAGLRCPECPQVEIASAEALQDHCDSHMSLLSLGRLKALFKMILGVQIADSAIARNF